MRARRLTPAQRWGGLLRRVLAVRGMSASRLARLMGQDRNVIHSWTAGRCLPQHEAAVRAADLLDDDALATLSLALRTTECVVCGISFTDGGRQRKARYCSGRCGQVARYGRKHEGTRRRSLLALRRVRIYRETIDRYCRECEPEGLCRTPSCPIQMASLSPLRLADGSRERHERQ